MTRRLVPLAVGLASLLGLLMVVQPSRVIGALKGADLRLVGAAMLTAAFYVLEGARWHVLLGEAGVRLRLRESTLSSTTPTREAAA